MPIRRRFIRSAVNPPDTTPPSVPANVRVRTKTQTTFTVEWDVSTDNRSTSGYEVEFNGVLEPGTFNPVSGYFKQSLTAATAYNVRVRAFDNSGNRSAWSSTLAVTTDGLTGDISVTPTVATASSINLALAAVPASGRTVVEYEVQRSLNQLTWSNVNLVRNRVSLIPPRSTATPTKYVHPSGNLAGNSAYTTIQAALNDAVSGDEIVVGTATYTQRILWTRSGTVGSPIRIRAFDYDNPPTIDAAGLGISWNGVTGSGSVVALQASNIIWDGINIINSGSHGIQIGDAANNGFYISNTSTWYTNIKVYRSKITDCAGVCVVSLMADGYEITGCDLAAAQKGTFWEKSSGNPSGWSYAALLGGRNCTFRDNKVRQTVGEGIHLGHHISFLSSPSRAVNLKTFEVRGNTFYDCWSAPIYLTVCEDGVIAENKVFFTGDDRFWYNRNASSGYPQSCIALGCELGEFGNPTQVFDGTFAGVQNVDIENNIFNGANRIFTIGSFGPGGRYRNINLDHNTFFSNRGAFSSVYEVLSNEGTVTDDDLSNFQWRNNIFVAPNAASMSRTWNALGTGKVVQGNVASHALPSDLTSGSNIVTTSQILTNGLYLVSGVTWPSEATFDESNAFPHLSGSTVSPAVNSVASIGLSTDFYGFTRPSHTGNVDAGAISLSKPSSLSYVDSGATVGATNFYRVRYRDSAGVLSNWSTINSVYL